MRLRKVDMYEIMMDMAMNQWTLTWMTDEALKEKCGKQIMTTKHFSVVTNVTTFVINSFKLPIMNVISKDHIYMDLDHRAPVKS